MTYRAAAPEMISMSSLVMTACLVRLKVRVSLSIISARKQGEKKKKISISHCQQYIYCILQKLMKNQAKLNF